MNKIKIFPITTLGIVLLLLVATMVHSESTLGRTLTTALQAGCDSFVTSISGGLSDSQFFHTWSGHFGNHFCQRDKPESAIQLCGERQQHVPHHNNQCDSTLPGSTGRLHVHTGLLEK